MQKLHQSTDLLLLKGYWHVCLEQQATSATMVHNACTSVPACASLLCMHVTYPNHAHQHHVHCVSYTHSTTSAGYKAEIAKSNTHKYTTQPLLLHVLLELLAIIYTHSVYTAVMTSGGSCYHGLERN